MVRVVGNTYQIQDRNLHHTLIEIGRSVFDDLDCHNFLRLEILAFNDLSKRSLAEDIENEVAVPAIVLANGYWKSQEAIVLVASFLRA